MPVPHLCTVRHTERIHAPRALVAAQFADLEHHIRTRVHPNLTFRPLGVVDGRMRYEQKVRLLGLTQRDVFERHPGINGEFRDVSIEGFNRGGNIAFSFESDGPVTLVTVTISLPVPWLLRLLEPLLVRQVRRELAKAAAEDRGDLESGRYPSGEQPARAAIPQSGLTAPAGLST